MLPPTHELRVTVFGLISDRDLSACWTRFLGKLKYRLGKDGFEFHYFLQNEWHDGPRHVHVLVRTDGELSPPLVRELWAKSCPGLPFTHHCAPVRDVEAMARYVVKHLKDGRKKEVPPRSFGGRIYRSSQHFFTKKVAELWQEQLKEWYGDNGGGLPPDTIRHASEWHYTGEKGTEE